MRGVAQSDYELLQEQMRQLERENAALRERHERDEVLIGQCADEILHFERENAELRADKERLDWLDDYGYEYDGLLERGWGIGLPAKQKSNTRNLRAAIDAAKKEAQP